MKKEPKKLTALDEFSKEFINVLPMNNFQKIFKQIEGFDGETPETLLWKIKNKSSNFPQISDERQKSLQNKFRKAVYSPEYALQMKTKHEETVKFIKSHLKKDSRYSHLINLINKADKNVDFVSLSFLAPFAHPEQNFILLSKPVKLLEEINNNYGEKRKNFIVELFKEIPEPIYKNYLECIYKLSFVAESEKLPTEICDFGDLVVKSSHRLKDFSGLVASEIKLLRNSFAHNNFKYNLNDDSFIVWDKKTPTTKMSANEIVKIANEVTSMCVETFPLVAQLYLIRNFYLNSGFLDLLLEKMPALISENPEEVSKAEKELSDFGQLLTEPMQNFFQNNQ
jgi:hypothetical protein